MKKIFDASKLIIGAGISLNLISLILMWCYQFVSYGDIKNLLFFINILYEYALWPTFIGLFAWAGARAVKEYNFSIINAGIVSAFSYLCTSIVTYTISIISSTIIAQFTADSDTGSIIFASLQVFFISVVIFSIFTFAIGVFSGFIVKRFMK